MNAETRATGICNPYESPEELTPDRMAARRRFPVLLFPALLVAALGAVVTAGVALNSTTSVLVAFLPMAFSLALSIWLVCYHFARNVAAGRVLVVLFGSVLSVAATGYCLDNPFTIDVINPLIQFAVASVGGATVFAASLVLSRISRFSSTLLFVAWFAFASAMFASLAFFNFVSRGSNPILCIVICATFFQSVVVTTIAMYMNTPDSSDT